MKITKVEPLLLDRFLYVRVHTDSGIVGIGESGTWGQLEASAASIAKYGEYLVGKDPFPIEHHWNVMLRANHFTGGAITGAVSAIEEISAIINQINDISSSIASAEEEQTVTTNEIGRSVNEAAQGVNDITRNIVGVAAAARNTTQGANDTKTASLELSEMAARLQSAVSRFTF